MVAILRKDIMRIMYDRVYHVMGLDASAKFAPTLQMRNGNARYRRDVWHEDQVMRWWMLHGNVSQKGYGNALIGRYGGYFEERYNEDYVWQSVSCHGFGCIGEVCTNSPDEKWQCTVPKRLAKYGWWKCQQSNTHISLKNSYTYYR